MAPPPSVKRALPEAGMGRTGLRCRSRRGRIPPGLSDAVMAVVVTVMATGGDALPIWSASPAYDAMKV